MRNEYYSLSKLLDNWKKIIKTNNKELKIKLTSKQYYELTKLCNYLDSEDQTTLQNFILVVAFEYFINNYYYEEISDIIMDNKISFTRGDMICQP